MVKRRNVCRHAVLKAGVLESGNFQFAGGSRANNKLNMDNLYKRPFEFAVILHHLGRLAATYGPELIIGIPRGGEIPAKILSNAKHLNVPVAHLIKVENVPGRKTYTYKSDEDREKVEAVKRLVVIDDVFNEFTSAMGVLSLPGIQERTAAVIGIWDRGSHPSRISLPVPQQALVTEHIRNILHEDDEIYKYAVRSEEHD